MVRTTADGRVPKIGEVYNIFFSGQESAQSGWRPGVIFQNNIGNRHSPNVIALPMTSSIKRLDMPTHVFLSADKHGLKADSVVICENPQCIPKSNIGMYITALPNDDMKRIAVASLIATSSLSFLSEEDLVNTRLSTMQMNNGA